VENSKPWEPYHSHKKPEKLTPGEIYEFNISLVPTGNLFKADSRIVLKISSVDDEPTNPLELIATGSLKKQSVSRITLHRNEDYPSCLVLPVTRGNILQTFMSGGKFPG
jgi:predicted acyl esterase